MADFSGEMMGTGLNTILAVGLEETTYGTAAAAEMWSSLVDELRMTREDMVYEARGISNVRTLIGQVTSGTRYPVSLRGKIDSGVPFAMVGGYISATNNPTISIFRGITHTTPSKVFLPSWTIKRSFDDESDDLNINGVVFDTGTFSCDLDGPWTFDISGVGKSQAAVATTGVAIPQAFLGSWNTTTKIAVDETTFTDAGALQMDGLRNVALTINNNLRIRNEFGTSAPVAIRQPKYGFADIELRLTRGYIDDDLWSQIADGGVNSFVMLSISGSVLINQKFDSCYAKTTEQPINNDDETLETVVMSVKDWNCTVTDGVTYVAWD